MAFGLTPSPAILTEIIQHHVTRYLLDEPVISKILASGFYVNDFTSGAQTVEEGLNIYLRTKRLMQQGGSNLWKWKTNSKMLQ